MVVNLVESSGGRVTNAVWSSVHGCTNMNDILDAYSVHIYWNYWDIPRMEFRLRDVRQIVTEELPAEARKPVFVTEFGVRGILNFPGKPAFQPGYWEDGTQMSRTNIEAFQMLGLTSCRRSSASAATVKWDAYWGKYAADYNAVVVAHLSRRGGLAADARLPRAAAVAADDGARLAVPRCRPVGRPTTGKLDADDRPFDQPEKEVAAFAGPNGDLTLMGLDTHGRALNAAAAGHARIQHRRASAVYHFNLVLWNGSGER